MYLQGPCSSRPCIMRNYCTCIIISIAYLLSNISKHKSFAMKSWFFIVFTFIELLVPLLTTVHYPFISSSYYNFFVLFLDSFLPSLATMEGICFHSFLPQKKARAASEYRASRMKVLYQVLVCGIRGLSPKAFKIVTR